MTLSAFLTVLAQLSALLFIVASMLVTMGMSLTTAQLLVEQPEAKHPIPVHSRVPGYNS